MHDIVNVVELFIFQAKLRYNPVEVDPEDMVRMASEEPRVSGAFSHQSVQGAARYVNRDSNIKLTHETRDMFLILVYLIHVIQNHLYNFLTH